MMAGIIPSFNFSKPELHRLDCDADVACGNQARAATKRRAVDAGDDRLRAFCDCQEHASDGEGIAEVLVMRVLDHPFHPVQIRARTE
jgi:hypothetical protein